MEPIPLETLVDYHGSQAHGRYVVTAHVVPDDLFTAGELAQLASSGETLDTVYPDGVAYTIWREGTVPGFGNREAMVCRVRRRSLTPASDSSRTCTECKEEI